MSLRGSIARLLPEALREPAQTILGLARKARVDSKITAMLGPRYRRSRTRIEIDITWACNLRCFNCNRSCEQAPTGESMTTEQVRRFVQESLQSAHRWERIRVIGGEPTLHPTLDEILTELLRYKAVYPSVTIEIASHGYGERTKAALARLPPGVSVENSAKESPLQPFQPFNLAPIDDPTYDRADFRNGCPVTQVCGVGLGPYGYYPCAVAAGIDRVMGYDLGRKTLPASNDDMEPDLATFCKVCGHFKREHRRPITGPLRSPTWEEAYLRWHKQRPSLGTYGCRPES